MENARRDLLVRAHHVFRGVTFAHITARGANLVTLSPDERSLAILYSYTNKPWELYLQENKAGAKPQQVVRISRSDTVASAASKEKKGG